MRSFRSVGWRSSVVEQLLGKQQVGGSNPPVGSTSTRCSEEVPLAEIITTNTATAIKQLRGSTQIVEYYHQLVDRHARERPGTGAEDAALEEINAALGTFALPVQEKWREAIPELQ